MATSTRIYAVEDSKNKTVALVEATTPAQARGHCARKQYAAKVATQTQLVELLGKGIKVEKANDDQDTDELPLEADKK